MDTLLEVLVKELRENGVSCKGCEIVTDNDGNPRASEPFLVFSEYDKAVAKEKDKRIAELEKEIEEIKKDWCFARMSELEDRHQSDCIRINQLLTTIDVLTERYQKLREVHGL